MATGGRAWGGDRARAGAGGAGSGFGGAMAERGPAFCGLYDTSSLLQYCNGETPSLAPSLPRPEWDPLPTPSFQLHPSPLRKIPLSPPEQRPDSGAKSPSLMMPGSWFPTHLNFPVLARWLDGGRGAELQDPGAAKSNGFGVGWSCNCPPLLPSSLESLFCLPSRRTDRWRLRVRFGELRAGCEVDRSDTRGLLLHYSPLNPPPHPSHLLDPSPLP